ncbi:phage hyaluronidase [Streptococcus pneumoniae]|nr:phage hyaluronidase [Streptococcus pneumoniae]
MDALTRRQFDRAMFAKDRTLAIRVGDYASRDIKEASFEYGYIKGDTYKPGGTCAGSGKITFTSIITTFNKLDILHPEIGLLVGNTYQWVKMGEYFINDIEIDRNRNTTTLELMDGMFKLNREYVTDLHFPAEVREVIQEICLKTGIELANDYFGISAMRYHVEQVPEGKKLSFRDMLSAMAQMIGMSCFFNREGKMEIRDLTESNITINADSYFLHGLTKSEIEYQIAGITCKTDKKPLTVGMKTGRSLELDNIFMTQSALNDLYYKLKNLTYYPYNLNYQGHLLLEVGQWVTIQTNKKETFKVPVLSQSFTFKGGLRGRISADSKSGNDTQYSYEGTITKQIKQQDGIEAKIQAQIEAADAAFEAEFKKRKKEIDDGIELAKAKAEEVKQELSDTINQRFDSFDNGPLKEAKRKAEEALKKAGASSSLAQEAKQIGMDSIAKLEAFKSQATSAQTALSGDLDALKQTITNDIRLKQVQAEAEIAKQVEALNKTKNELAGVKSAQATYEETTTRRLSELTNLANGKASKSELTQTAEELASKIASVRVGGRNHYRDSEKVRTSTRFFPFPLHPYLTQENVGEIWTLSFDLKINEGGEIRPLHFYHYQTNRFGLRASADITPSKDWQRFTFTGPVIFPNDDPRYSRGEMALYDYGGNNNYSVRRIKLEKGTLATDWSPAIEDTDSQISAVESNFKQRADALDAGVRRLTEGLRTKADISSLNVTAENIRQSVKSLETSTQNKLDQKLSQAEFEVQAGSIRQEILNATKDKADKTLVVAEAGKLREEFSNLRVGGRNYYQDSEKVRTSTRFFSFPLHLYLTQENVGETWTLSFDLKINEGGEIRPLHFYHYQTNRFGIKASGDITPSKEWQRFTFTGSVIFPNDDPRYARGEMALYDYGGNNNYSVRRIKLEKGTLATDWSPAVEDTDGLITEAKATFERTAQGLRTDLSAIQEYVNKDGQRQDVLQRYAREESAKQATAVRELVAKDYVGKTTYQEDVKGINQKIEAVKTSANKEIASQIASYRQSVDGKFTDISSQITTYKQDVGGQISGLSNRLTSSEQGTTTHISNLKTQVATNKDNAERQMGRISDQVSANKADADSQFKNVTNQLARKVETTDFQRVKETSQLYERILGNTENGIADKVARMAMTNQLFQVEVSKNEGLKTVQRQLADSWSVQNINSAGDIISGINLGATGHNRITGKLTHITGETLIDNAVIKSAMIDKLKTANFESGSVTTKILDAEAVTADKVRFDDAFIRKMIANEAFIEQLTSKQIFATKVESVVSSSTFLEAYQGRIGGFTIGHFDQGRGRWISGINQFSVGMGNGEGGSYNGENTAFWANWGYSWNSPGPNAWYVTTSGNMYCRNGADFHGKVDFSNRSTVNFYSQPSFSNGAVINGSLRVSGRITYSGGEWLYSPIYNKLWKDNSQGGEWLYLDRQGNSGRDWIQMNKEISDRRYKSNIQDSQVSGLDAINNLKTYSYRKEYDGKIEDIACGIMAQDVQKYAPEAFYENPDGAYSYRTFELVPYLIKAIQELNQKIEKMEKIIA